MRTRLPLVLLSLGATGARASAREGGALRNQNAAAAALAHVKGHRIAPAAGLSSTGRRHREVEPAWTVVSAKVTEPAHAYLHLAAMNASTRSASAARAERLGADVCGCSRDDVCSCEAQFAFLQCVQKSCAEKKCDCPDPATEVAQLCSVSSASCQDDLDISCGKEHSCKGWFHQARDGVVGFTLNTEHIGERAYCGPFGKCEGELQVTAQLHRAYQGVWLECRLKGVGAAGAFTSCTSEVFTATTKCRMPMVQGLAFGQELVGKCWLTEGQSGSPITNDAWFTLSNRHNKMETEPVQKSGVAGAGRLLLAGLAALASAARLA